MLQLQHDGASQRLLKKLKSLLKPYFQVFSNLKQGIFMTFQQLATFCKSFGLFPEAVSKQSLIHIY